MWEVAIYVGGVRLGVSGRWAPHGSPRLPLDSLQHLHPQLVSSIPNNSALCLMAPLDWLLDWGGCIKGVWQMWQFISFLSFCTSDGTARRMRSKNTSIHLFLVYLRNLSHGVWLCNFCRNIVSRCVHVVSSGVLCRDDARVFSAWFPRHACEQRSGSVKCMRIGVGVGWVCGGSGSGGFFFMAWCYWSDVTGSHRRHQLGDTNRVTTPGGCRNVLEFPNTCTLKYNKQMCAWKKVHYRSIFFLKAP